MEVVVLPVLCEARAVEVSTAAGAAGSARAGVVGVWPGPGARAQCVMAGPYRPVGSLRALSPAQKKAITTNRLLIPLLWSVSQ